jgi:glycosyltransferase involved in cell wall biosynthesis
VISLRYPSYAVRHPRHVCWLNHTMREYYDLWDRFSSGLSRRGLLKERVRRRLIHAADRYLLSRNVSRLFVQSRTIQDRLRIWPEVRSTVLYPPPPPRPYRCEGYGDYVFMVSRLTPLKRTDLFLQALATAQSAGIKAVIGGDGEDRNRLDMLVRRLGLTDRVILAGALSESELLHHLAHCRAVCFPPSAEDYGFVTVEAFASGKAVVTCTDSGGPAELVEDGVSGFICAPTADALAPALRRLLDDPVLAARLGQQGRAVAERMKWSDVVEQLTAV